MDIARTLRLSLLFVCGIGAASCSMHSTAASYGAVGANFGVAERRPWSKHPPLSWSDFSGMPPASGADAATVYAIAWRATCTAGGFESDAVAIFFPRQSWVKSAVLLDPESRHELLRHEQTHFDLAEVFARTMRRYFATADRPCDHGKSGVRAQAREFERGGLVTQSQYDEETYNGRDPQMQGRWEDAVERSLSLLDPFGSQIDTRYWIRGVAR